MCDRQRIAKIVSDTFNILAKKGIISETPRNDLVKLVRFRNRLSHKYFDLDEQELYALYADTHPLQDFIILVKRLLKSEGNQVCQEK